MKYRRLINKVVVVILTLVMFAPSIIAFAAPITPDNTFTVFLVPNGHIDTAWRWPFQHTAEVVINDTFTRQVNALKTNPTYRFTMSASKHYEWVKEYYPALYADVKTMITGVDADGEPKDPGWGEWGIAGGQVVEPDLNLISGESMARQSLYAQHFFLREFGRVATIAYVPDVFGFSGQFPQFVKKSEMNYFVTTKLNWQNDNSGTDLRYGAFDPGVYHETQSGPKNRESDVFWWEGIDGSDVLSYACKYDYTGTAYTASDITGSGAETVFNRNRRSGTINYNYNGSGSKAYTYDYNSYSKIALGMFGTGDHGGGPATGTGSGSSGQHGYPGALNTSIGNSGPTVKSATIEEFFRAFEDESSWDTGHDSSGVFRSVGENYLGYHRGVYTSWSRIKKYNRQNEILGEKAEKASTLAFWANAIENNGADRIEGGWDKILVNQMHDVLPGSCAPYQVYVTFNYQELAKNLFTNVQNNALLGLAHRADTTVSEGVPVFVYNALSWERNGETTVDVKLDKQYPYIRVYDGATELPANILKNSPDGSAKISFIAKGVPSLGYKVFKVVGATAPSAFVSDVTVTESDSEIVVSNNNLQFTIDKTSGNISSMVNKKDGDREVFYTEDIMANELQYVTGENGANGWPAWDVGWTAVGDPSIRWNRVQVAQVCQILDTSSEKVTIAVTQNFLNSYVTRYITLLAGSDKVDVKMEINWGETDTNLKLAFPIAADARGASYEIAYGALDGAKEVERMDAVDADHPFGGTGALGRSTLRGPSRFLTQRFEQSGHKWMDITADDKAFGVSILNDAKYGYDVLRFTRGGSQTTNGCGNSPTIPEDQSYVRARISVLRSASAADLNQETSKYGPASGKMDRGYQEFNYSIYPHAGTWQDADTSTKAHELCYPMDSFQTVPSNGGMGSQKSFLSTNKANVKIGALKNQYDAPTDNNTFIVRLWESDGVDTPVTLTLPSNVISAKEVNILEHEYVGKKPLTINDDKIAFTIGHYEIVTLEVKLAAYEAAPIMIKQASANLGDFFDINGVSDDSNRRAGNLDGSGNTVPARNWPESVNYQGVKFSMGPATSENYVAADGQIIPLPAGQYGKVFLLGAGAGSGDKSGEFTVNYTDGSSVKKNISFAIWNTDLSGYDRTAWVDNKPYVYDSIGYVFTHYHDGTSDQMTRNNFLFVYSIDVDSSKTLSSITLPVASGIKITSITAADSAIPGFASIYAAPEATKYDPPTNVTASVIESNQNALVSWTAPESDVRAYIVYAGLTADFNITDGIRAGVAGGMATSFIYEPVDRRAVFYFRVVAMYPDDVLSAPSNCSNSVLAGIPPSTECDILSLEAPLKMVGTDIRATVTNHTTRMNLTEMFEISTKANWALYSNDTFTTSISKTINPLMAGANVRYIRVTAQDGITHKDYTLTITRMNDVIARFTTPPPLDGTLNPADWGGKVFTIADGADGITVKYYNRKDGYPPAGFKADLYMGYDSSNVYLGAIVEDPLWEPARPGTGTLWQGCGFQLNLWNGRSGARSEYGFGLAASGPAHFQWANGSGTTSLPTGYSNYSIKRVEGTDTFIYTIAIPLNSFKQNAATNPLAEGDEVLFSITYNYPNEAVGNMNCVLDMDFMVDSNEKLNYARILTLGPDIASAATQVVKADIVGSTVRSVTVQAKAPDTPMLYLGAYDQAGRLLSFKSVDVAFTGGRQAINVDYDFGDAWKVKAFLWDKDSFVPLVEAKVIYGY